ncbi:multiple inositol polyphosphate phosphatase 1 isoform X1 [Oncorhynchus tshawytscha]|uniref:multiple inositol polyphosphate phosphatase 1 isoform X1 n=1 Tax=Oncorhynchus tshawytscha TaxID=74940 RepID=UPI000D0989FE|nr:multiple inositol polyphosphate phosphatase 1 isoform X1 [Oncorhynchus tshawytscha]
MTTALSKQSLLFITFSLALTRFSYCSVANASVNSNIPAIANHFGTKGRYEEVNRYLINDILSVNKNKSILKPGCTNSTAIHVTAIIRHGTRYPSTKNIKMMQRLYDLVLNEAMNTDKWLKEIKTKWEMWYTDDMDGKLVEKGRDDHRHLAVRLATLFPSLISEENLRAHRIRFITSSKHRCVDSIVAFQEGLLNLWNVTEVGPSHKINDGLMRFFDQCQKFVEDVENNQTALEEVHLFKASAEMKRVQMKMADQLQMPYNRITPDLVEAAFFLCSYEFAIKSLNSAWCNLFDETDAQVLEYKNDLKQYWKRGYGHDINRKSSCNLFHDLFNRFDQAAREIRFGHVSEAVTIQVGHAETLLPLLALMGFFRDETALTADNFDVQNGRTFRTSRIVPYAANLLFVLYDCSEGLRLQFLLNETPQNFPDIMHQAPLYDTVRETYRELLHGCNFEKECELPRPNS